MRGMSVGALGVGACNPEIAAKNYASLAGEPQSAPASEIYRCLSLMELEVARSRLAVEELSMKLAPFLSNSVRAEESTRPPYHPVESPFGAELMKNISVLSDNVDRMVGMLNALRI